MELELDSKRLKCDVQAYLALYRCTLKFLCRPGLPFSNFRKDFGPEKLFHMHKIHNKKFNFYFESKNILSFPKLRNHWLRRDKQVTFRAQKLFGSFEKRTPNNEKTLRLLEEAS